MGASKAELWTQMANAIKAVDGLFKHCATDTPNFLGLVDTLQQSYEGSHINNTNAGFNTLIAQMSGICGSSTMLDSLIIELARVGYNSQAATAANALDDIYRGMLAASETVKHRNWTADTINTAAINTGTGIPYRCVTDEGTLTIESGNIVAGKIVATIIADQSSGVVSGNEPCLIAGEGVIPTDNIRYGDVPAGNVQITAKRAADGLLTNANFATINDDGTYVTFDGWTAGNTTKATHLSYDTATYFRKIDVNTTGKSAKFITNNTLKQWVANINVSLPLMLIVRYYRSAVDGALTINIGSKTASVADLTAVADTTWHDLVMVNSSSIWYNNYKEAFGGAGVEIGIELSGHSTGTLLLGEIVLVQPALFNGAYYLLTAGATDFLKGDNWDWTDTVANTGRIQTTLARLYRKYLPYTASTPTYADA